MLEARAQVLVVEDDRFKDLGVRPERNRGAGAVGCRALLKRGLGHTAVVALRVDVALSVNLNLEVS